MNPSTKRLPSRLAVLLATSGVAILWSMCVLGVIGALGVAIAVLFGVMPNETPVTTTGRHAIFSVAGLLLVSGYSYFIIALRLRCPSCGFQFLRNPKGMGPANFVYHPNCPRTPYGSPWALQMVRYLRTRRIRCIQCGEETFEDPPQDAHS